MPGLMDAEDIDGESSSDGKDDDEETVEDESCDSSSAVLGSGERQDRGGVRTDTPSLNSGPQIGGTPPREEDLEGGSRDDSPAPALADIDGDSSSDDEGPGGDDDPPSGFLGPGERQVRGDVHISTPPRN